MDKKVFYAMFFGLVFLWIFIPAVALIFKSPGVLHAWWATGVLTLAFGSYTIDKDLH